MGYSGEIFDLQKRHLPPRIIHPNMGMFSRHVRRVSQAGHRDGGVTMLRPRGTRYAITLMSDPKHAPKAKVNTASGSWKSTSWMGISRDHSAGSGGTAGSPPAPPAP